MADRFEKAQSTTRLLNFAAGPLLRRPDEKMLDDVITRPRPANPMKKALTCAMNVGSQDSFPFGESLFKS
jgi:hypothetical protein